MSDSEKSRQTVINERDWAEKNCRELRAQLAAVEAENARCREIAERDGKDYSELKAKLTAAENLLRQWRATYAMTANEGGEHSRQMLDDTNTTLAKNGVGP